MTCDDTKVKANYEKGVWEKACNAKAKYKVTFGTGISYNYCGNHVKTWRRLLKLSTETGIITFPVVVSIEELKDTPDD